MQASQISPSARKGKVHVSPSSRSNVKRRTDSIASPSGRSVKKDKKKGASKSKASSISLLDKSSGKWTTVKKPGRHVEGEKQKQRIVNAREDISTRRRRNGNVTVPRNLFPAAIIYKPGTTSIPLLPDKKLKEELRSHKPTKKSAGARKYKDKNGGGSMERSDANGMTTTTGTGDVFTGPPKRRTRSVEPKGVKKYSSSGTTSKYK